jgi:NDP-sugar pyrophosphorylase family protein
MVISRSALEAIPSAPGGVPEHVWEPAIGRGDLGGIVVSGHWREIGTPESYREAVISRAPSLPCVDRSARVDPAASLGEAVIGPEAVVEAGAVVAGSVVTHGAVIRRDARVIESVLIGRVETSPGERVTRGARAAWPIW